MKLLEFIIMQILCSLDCQFTKRAISLLINRQISCKFISVICQKATMAIT